MTIRRSTPFLGDRPAPTVCVQSTGRDVCWAMQTSELSMLCWCDRVTVVPPYSDASMLLHRNIYAVRDGMVEDVWSLEGTIGLMQ